MVELSILLIILTLGLIIMIGLFLLSRSKNRDLTQSARELHSSNAELKASNTSLETLITDLKVSLGKLESEKILLRERMTDYEQRMERLIQEHKTLSQEQKNMIDALVNERESLAVQLGEQRTAFAKAEQQNHRAKEELQDLNKRFSKEFENLAQKILEEKSTRFTDQNKKNIEQILTPLQEKIQRFEKRVDETHKDSIERQSLLRQQIIGLKELNQQMSEETSNLTKALKGDAKMRGNWGELVLERVLEKSGLVKGSEYEVQQSFKTTDGSTLFPDVVINLPGGRRMIVDSKVSLVAYERCVNESDEILQQQYLKQHVAALNRHVDELSSKNYHDLYGVESPDFVLLFVPIEPAFAMALNHDGSLYSNAFDKNIVIVTPTTLLATLRTIDTIWQTDKQQKNAQDIAIAAGALYDKFVGLSEDLLKIKSQLDTVNKSYNRSLNKLSEGSGNLIGKVQKLKIMGAKANKSIDSTLVNKALDTDPEL